MAVKLFPVRFRCGRGRSRVVAGVWAVPVLVLPLMSVTGCERELTEPECEQLLDRYVELLARSRMPDASAESVEQMQSEARERVRSSPRFRDCREFFSRRDFDCAIQEAKTVDELERCLL
jgi:hypothetical protein